MKKIKDERLILKNLKNVRITYFIQTIGILGILGYDLVTKGINGMTENPLWFVFVVGTIVSTYLSMGINVEHETNNKVPKKGLIISVVISALISIIIGFLLSLTDGFGLLEGLIIGAIFFICSLIPNFYIYYLRTKRQD
ncbi:DUF1761 domain-containing protein [Carnobacterium funditum]|uniref:DUF1761 domain-containing protein n=1 Tax=Carnobacterium funditum TaxID=2752 RepID=UPI000553E5B2|nr:DUF1761 domain-containing protein [Carnobacterium funditum]